MAVKANTASGAENSARSRLVAARIALSAGWVALVVSLPMIMNYAPGGSAWNPGPLRPITTWAAIHSVLSVGVLGSLLLAPFFVGLAAGTLGTLLPTLYWSRPLAWSCRIFAFGVWESSAVGVEQVVDYLFGGPMIGGVGVGFFFFVFGSLLIGLSAWIRPVEAGKSGRGPNQHAADPQAGLLPISGKRLAVARLALFLGWLALALSMPRCMAYEPDWAARTPWNLPLIPHSTWEMIYGLLAPPNSLAGSLMGTLLLSPFFIGTAAGSLATTLPQRYFRPWLAWLCRVVTAGICVSWSLGLAQAISKMIASNMKHSTEVAGNGFLFFAVGSLLIGLSAWIRPVRAKIDGENGKQSASSDANPNSGTGET